MPAHLNDHAEKNSVKERAGEVRAYLGKKFPTYLCQVHASISCGFWLVDSHFRIDVLWILTKFQDSWYSFFFVLCLIIGSTKEVSPSSFTKSWCHSHFGGWNWKGVSSSISRRKDWNNWRIEKVFNRTQITWARCFGFPAGRTWQI